MAIDPDLLRRVTDALDHDLASRHSIGAKEMAATVIALVAEAMSVKLRSAPTLNEQTPPWEVMEMALDIIDQTGGLE